MNRYSTVWRRLFAGLLDGLVLLPLGIVAFRIDSPEDGTALFLVWSAIFYTSAWLYNVLFHWRSGQTLGKRALGVQVLDISESRIPSLQQAVMRDIVYIVINTLSLAWLAWLVLSGQYTAEAYAESAAETVFFWGGTAWFVLEIVSTLTNSKRRAVHDFIAGTVVVRKT